MAFSEGGGAGAGAVKKYMLLQARMRFPFDFLVAPVV